MRKTIGKLIRKYLYDKRLGTRRVVAIYRDGEKIWPTLRDTVASFVIDTNELEGTVDWAYWLHALDAVEKLGAGAECYIKLTAGGREYMLGETFDNWYLAGYDGRATVVFGDNGPLWDKLQPGDEVVVELRVPARESTEYNEEAVCYLPHLSGTKLRVVFSKGKKDKWAGRRFTVTGQPGGVVHWGGSCETSEHKRGTKTRVLPGNTHKWYKAVHNDAMVAGETSLEVNTAGIGSATRSGGVTFLWPGFSTQLRLRVSAVIRHE